MHCGTEFSVPEEGAPSDDRETNGDGLDAAIGGVVSDIFDGSDRADRRDDGSVTGEAEPPVVDTGGEDTDASAEAADTTTGPPDAVAGGSTDESGLMHPDSLLDNSLTVLAGSIAGLLIGVVGLFAFLATLGAAGLPVALVLWIGSTAVLARRPTVFDTVKYAAYTVAALLVLVPGAAAVADGGSVGSRLATFAVVLLPMGILAAIVAGVGYAVGTRGVE
jgi:hypothetical protein